MVKNMTPHAITIIAGETRTIPSVGQIRLEQKDEMVGCLEVEGLTIPLTKTCYGGAMWNDGGAWIEGLPPVEEGTCYIVSALVKNACSDREDFLVPASMERNGAGVIIGCKSLGV